MFFWFYRLLRFLQLQEECKNKKKFRMKGSCETIFLFWFTADFCNYGCKTYPDLNVSQLLLVVHRGRDVAEVALVTRVSRAHLKTAHVSFLSYKLFNLFFEKSKCWQLNLIKIKFQIETYFWRWRKFYLWTLDFFLFWSETSKLKRMESVLIETLGTMSSKKQTFQMTFSKP